VTLRDPEILARIRALAIPPAWRDVWICPDPLGHLQATGVDAAGRKQYLYHEHWRAHRDRQKFDKMVHFGRALPGLRLHVERDLAGSELTRDRVLAAAVRLLDRGFFRIGGEGYVEDNGSYGLATMERRHVSLEPNGRLVFDYPAKGGRRRLQSVVDPEVYGIVAELRRRRSGKELLAYRENGSWRDVRSADINGYIKQATGEDFSAKDFRTWNATVLAAVALSVLGQRASSRTARTQVVRLAIAEVARYLGNTPAVCRASYVDPRVIDRFHAGRTIAGVGEIDDPSALEARGSVERSVLGLLSGGEPAPRPARRRTARDAPARPRRDRGRRGRRGSPTPRPRRPRASR
jgi:DNA topoisomerase IB